MNRSQCKGPTKIAVQTCVYVGAQVCLAPTQQLAPQVWVNEKMWPTSEVLRVSL